MSSATRRSLGRLDIIGPITEGPTFRRVRSPDGAKRHPGILEPPPDCASLHPGYEAAQIGSASADMHLRLLPAVPLAVQRALDLGGELQQEAVIGLLGDRLDAERQAVILGSHRQRD